MRVENPKKFRRLVANRCRYCDRQFFYRRDNRPKFYCDGTCRQADFRHARYLGSKRNGSPQKTETKSKTFRPDFADRPLPLNILGGGYRWPDSTPLDRQVLNAIIRTEIGGLA
jgi:hypothetical protein